ncbi:MAG: hypothetical protein GY945_07210, partial [Rhodobacteraceae bacterium]|nr:hypothetical protein [Paracoccaceae bacterium]
MQAFAEFATFALPPHQHLKKINGPVGDNPDNPATADIEFGNAAHTGSPPGHWHIENLTPRDKNIARISRKRHRVNLKDLERVFQLWSANKGDIAGLPFREF